MFSARHAQLEQGQSKALPPWELACRCVNRYLALAREEDDGAALENESQTLHSKASWGSSHLSHLLDTAFAICKDVQVDVSEHVVISRARSEPVRDNVRPFEAEST